MSNRFEWLVDKITNRLADSNLIKADELKVYHFGIEIALLKLLHFISYIIIALCMDRLVEFFVIFSVFYIFRKNAGGYHSKTRWGCYLFSCTLIAGALGMTGIVFNLDVICMITAIDLIILHCWAPVQNANRKLDEKEINFFKNRLLVISVIFVVVSLITILERKENMILLYTEGLSLSVILVIMGRFRTEYDNDKRKDDGK